MLRKLQHLGSECDSARGVTPTFRTARQNSERDEHVRMVHREDIEELMIRSAAFMQGHKQR